MSANAPITHAGVLTASPPELPRLRGNPTEIANSITHGLGFLLSLAAAAVLLPAAMRGDALQLWACMLYAATMISVYAMSTASHLFLQPKWNHLFRMLDQGCIYLFIAGTFTPVAAAYLRNGWWWLLPALVWAIAILGFLSKVVFVHRIQHASVVIPVLLGWLPITGGQPLLAQMPIALFWWMLAGGVCYTVGTVFLVNDHRHRYLHAVWHLWVIAGSACQFYAILRYALPAA